MSSAIANISYTEKTRTLTISFVKGGSHQYHDVPPEVVEELKNAGSQGAYFNENIRKAYG
jgi:hypothetical protein